MIRVLRAFGVLCLGSVLAMAQVTGDGVTVDAGTYKSDGDLDASDGTVVSTGDEGHLDFDGPGGSDSDWTWDKDKKVYNQDGETNYVIFNRLEVPAGAYAWTAYTSVGAVIDNGIISPPTP